jgi:hypothetical protein
MHMLLNEAVLPALARLRWGHIPLTDRPAVVVPLACEPPSTASVLVTVETDDERQEAWLHAMLSVVPVARRAAVALHLAELNTHYPFVTFSMTREGEVRIDVGVELFGVVEEMRSVVVEIGMRRMAQALTQTYRDVQRVTVGRRRRPRVEREVDEVLRSLEQ